MRHFLELLLPFQVIDKPSISECRIEFLKQVREELTQTGAKKRRSLPQTIKKTTKYDEVLRDYRFLCPLGVDETE